MTIILRYAMKFCLTFLLLLPAEFSHKVGVFLIGIWGRVCRFVKIVKLDNVFGADFPKSEASSQLFGGKLKHAVGVAAGLDKNCKAVGGLFGLGFSFAEIGTVTPKPQVGKVKPRLFRLTEYKSLVNCMGFPNDGAEVVLNRLKKFNESKRETDVVGVNIGRNADSDERDYIELYYIFSEHCDYLTLNISSPNTANLREMFEPEKLKSFLLTMCEARRVSEVNIPLFLKFSPDLSSDDFERSMLIASEAGIDGIIVSNTTISKDFFAHNHKYSRMPGGLSGQLLEPMAVNLLEMAVRINVTKLEKKLTIISSGGVMSKGDMQKRIDIGADLVQVYTGLIFGTCL